MSDEQRVDSARLQDYALAYQQSAALMSAVDLGVFTAIASGRSTVADVADAVGISVANADRLVAVLRAMDLIHEHDDRLVNAADAQRFLVEGTRDYAGPWIHFTRPSWADWGNLTEHLRSREESVLGMYDGLTVEGARKYHRATSSVGMGAGRRFSRHVDLSERTKLLDIGGGSGAYSIVAAQQHPGLEAVVFDLPPVVEVTREFIADAGVRDRVTAVGGDFTADPFPAGCDVAVMASNLPQYSRELIAMVIAKAYDALEPGGEMHLIGETLRDDRTGPIGSALWALNETLAGSTGVAHTNAECVGYFEAAGFVDVAVNEFVRNTLTRISGVKR